MMHMGDIISTMGDIQYRGGKILLLFEYSHGTEHRQGIHDTPTRIMISSHGTQITKDGILRRY